MADGCPGEKVGGIGRLLFNTGRVGDKGIDRSLNGNAVVDAWLVEGGLIDGFGEEALVSNVSTA